MTSLPSTINAINRLPEPEKRAAYAQVLPLELRQLLDLAADYHDNQGRDLLHLECPPGSPTVEMALYHRYGFRDPVLYGHLTDTLNGQVHILLYVINDPDSPRFDVDVLPDGTPTKFGILHRNLPAEQAAMQSGLAPGQVRRGLRVLRPAMAAFENFVQQMGHDFYFAEPLYYHNAFIFEHYGFSYEKGRKLMQQIHAGFSPGGDLLSRLDRSTAFRQPEAANSVRLRSWAIHDGLLGEPFNNVTMYKRVGKNAAISTCDQCPW
jgi:acetoin utilization protein AcuC